ncbi:unnamed protein product [Leptosia nina]|uniref:Uncharacterized protein n=1 Tax=Leptosia nina TaxID=320188 RepID=A0AAV1JQQ1_9NEOP
MPENIILLDRKYPISASSHNNEFAIELFKYSTLWLYAISVYIGRCGGLVSGDDRWDGAKSRTEAADWQLGLQAAASVGSEANIPRVVAAS